MLYKFKSAHAADVIMLEATGRQILQIMGKGPDAKGILLPEHMAQALAHLKQAIAEEEAILAKQKESPKSTAEQEDAAPAPAISLRTRAWPLVLMIERSQQAQVPVTWGV